VRLKDNSLSFVVNFLLGVAWAAAFIGAVSAFLSYYSDSILFAFISGVIAALPGMIGVLLLEHFISSKEKQFELQKQTRLLEELLKKEQDH
jgi:zinc transporter ZupT